MKTNRFSAKGHSCTGPGGWNCTCCGPSPKNRPLFARQHKKKTYRELDRELAREEKESFLELVKSLEDMNRNYT